MNTELTVLHQGGTDCRVFIFFSESRLQPASVTQHKMDSAAKSIEVVTGAHMFYARLFTACSIVFIGLGDFF